MAEVEAAVKPRRPTWPEYLALKKRIYLISQKIRDLCEDVKVLPGESEAELEAKKAEQKESLMREYLRLGSELRPPDFSGMSEADRAAEVERLRQEALAKARRLQMAGDPEGPWLEGEARILDFDPKQGGSYYNQCYLGPRFDHDEESPLGPMRFTGRVYENVTADHCDEAVNILSVKIPCSDVGFPIQVYGTVFVRDCIDCKRVYLFRRDRDHCQLINSKDEPLILTGPKRGLVLLDSNYVETDLKIKDHQGQDIRGLVLLDSNYVETDLKIKDHQGQDREFSKGVITIRGTAHRSLEKCEVERKSLATRLSTVDVLYAVVIGAVEATIAIRVLKGKFEGTITAHTTSIQKRVVLYDSKVAGTRTADVGVIRLTRRVVSVYLKDMLIIEVKTGDGKYVRIIEFTPRGNYGDEDTIAVGATKMRVMAAWSLMDP